MIHEDAGREAARRELEQLSEEDRAELTSNVRKHWSLNVNLAVRKLWNAAEVLGFQAGSRDPKHVAMVAATYLSRSPEQVYDELVKAAN